MHYYKHAVLQTGRSRRKLWGRQLSTHARGERQHVVQVRIHSLAGARVWWRRISHGTAFAQTLVLFLQSREREKDLTAQ